MLLLRWSKVLRIYSGLNERRQTLIKRLIGGIEVTTEHIADGSVDLADNIMNLIVVLSRVRWLLLLDIDGMVVLCRRLRFLLRSCGVIVKGHASRLAHR